MYSQKQQNDLLNLIQANLTALGAASNIIKSVSNEKYNEVASPYFESSLGKHMRHVLDHYLCFIRDVDTGVINYDQRDRDARLETDGEYTLSIIDNICQSLKQLSTATTADRSLKVLLCNDVNVPDGELTQSTVARELQFIQGHSVHHYALIVAMLRFYGVSINRELGVAPSTLLHEESIQASA